MTQLTDVQDFIERSSRAADFDELKLLLEAITHEMGFDHFALVQHVDIRRHDNRKTVWLENYPSSWAEAFVEQELYASDPIHMASQRTTVGFAWSDVPNMIRITPHHRRVLEAAAREGLSDGFTIPAHVPGESNGSCSFAVRCGRDLPRQNLAMAQLVGSFAFEAGRRQAMKHIAKELRAARPKLTTRQLECIVLAAKGKTDWEIGQILGLKQDTVTSHIEEARKRYDVKRRIQLFFRTVSDGHLALDDVIG